MPNSNVFLVRNGWKIFKHRIFEEAYSPLYDEVQRLKSQDADNFAQHPKAKLLARVDQLIYDEIPHDPADPRYRQGNTLGERHRAWSRAKFLGRFRLFFRFDSTDKAIIYCWLNDENTLRKYGSKTDPYRVFVKMLIAGNPPGSWAALKEAASSASTKHWQVREEI